MWNILRSKSKDKSDASKVSEEEEEEDYEEEEDDYDEDATSEENEEDEEEEKIDVLLIPSDQEKKAILASFDVMRKDFLFCDVTFMVQGILFRAHRVVVSSWSRWMKAFLCDAPEEEVMTLDAFAPDAFQSVLDYMYGQPLTLTIENADSIIKVVRRLELQNLEIQCWRYLITILDEHTNVEYLHDLADRYDCPPLKLAAWKILKEKVPNLDSFPKENQLMASVASAQQMTDMPKELAVRGTGFSWPGDPRGIKKIDTRAHHGLNDPDRFGIDEDEGLPSVFHDFSDDDEDHDDEDDEEDEEDDDSEEWDDDDPREIARQRRRAQKKHKKKVAVLSPSKRLINLDDITDHSTATEVINAWANRLKEVYSQCAPINAIDYEPSEFRFTAQTPNVKLMRGTGGGNRGESPARRYQTPKGKGHDKGGGHKKKSTAKKSYGSSTVTSTTDTHSVDSRKHGGGGGGGSVMTMSTLLSMSPKSPTANTGKKTAEKDTTKSASKDTKRQSLGPLKTETTHGKQGRKASAVGLPAASVVQQEYHEETAAVDWDEELRFFYQQMKMTDKMSTVPTILKAWRGKEEEMIIGLMEKYEGKMNKTLTNHLDVLLQRLEDEANTREVQQEEDEKQHQAGSKSTGKGAAVKPTSNQSKGGKHVNISSSPGKKKKDIEI